MCVSKGIKCAQLSQIFNQITFLNGNCDVTKSHPHFRWLKLRYKETFRASIDEHKNKLLKLQSAAKLQHPQETSRTHFTYKDHFLHFFLTKLKYLLWIKLSTGKKDYIYVYIQ